MNNVLNYWKVNNMNNLDMRLKKLEVTASGDSLYIGLAKIYCACEGIEFNAADYPAELNDLKWDDIFGSNQLIREN